MFSAAAEDNYSPFKEVNALFKIQKKKTYIWFGRLVVILRFLLKIFVQASFSSKVWKSLSRFCLQNISIDFKKLS